MQGKGVRLLGNGGGGGGGSKETERVRNKRGKTREAPVLCYSFSLGDTTVHFFPSEDVSEREASRGGRRGTEREKLRRGDEWTFALGSVSCGLPNLSGIGKF